jgi:molybdopterin molybdotransferase
MQAETASLHQQVTFQPPLTCFLQVKVESEQGLTVAHPLAGGGSGDFVNLLRADGFLELPPDRSEFLAGEQFPLIRFD